MKKLRDIPELDIRQVDNGNKISLSPHFYTQPRSQAIYGSLVETLGPYSPNYTRTKSIFTSQ